MPLTVPTDHALQSSMLCWAFDFITAHISWHRTIHRTIQGKQVCEVSEESDIPTEVICGLTMYKIQALQKLFTT